MQNINSKNILNLGILCHNHKDFIKDCLDSILCQNTSYPYNIIIVDDFSTDGTREILQKIANENSDKITLILNEKNIGALNSAKILAHHISAKYLCFLDGDDKWSYKNKLQTQIDFLENNKDYSACFHDAAIVQHNKSDDKDFLKRTQLDYKTYSQFNGYYEDFMPLSLLERNIIPTASLIFRNKDVLSFLNNYSASALSLSWALHLFIIKKSKFKYFNETWSVYNDHPNGVSKFYTIPEFKLNNINILKSLLEDPDWEYFKYEIYDNICKEYRMLLKTKSEIIKPKNEFKLLLKQYKKYLKQATKFNLQQLKDDFKYERINRLVE